MSSKVDAAKAAGAGSPGLAWENIRAFILGSTTATMVRTCLVPVLMFR